MRETVKHVRRVGDLMLDVTEKLNRRAMCHDDSKFSAEEFDAFAEATPRLRGLTYGSEEYKAETAKLGPALTHHYRNNDHHPEWHIDKVNGMDLMQMMEMLCDWKAATERHADGSLATSIAKNSIRFNFGDDIAELLARTACSMGWITGYELLQIPKWIEAEVAKMHGPQASHS